MEAIQYCYEVEGRGAGATRQGTLRSQNISSVFVLSFTFLHLNPQHLRCFFTSQPKIVIGRVFFQIFMTLSTKR